MRWISKTNQVLTLVYSSMAWVKKTNFSLTSTRPLKRAHVPTHTHTLILRYTQSRKHPLYLTLQTTNFFFLPVCTSFSPLPLLGRLRRKMTSPHRSPTIFMLHQAHPFRNKYHYAHITGSSITSSWSPPKTYLDNIWRHPDNAYLLGLREIIPAYMDDLMSVEKYMRLKGEK